MSPCVKESRCLGLHIGRLASTSQEEVIFLWSAQARHFWNVGFTSGPFSARETWAHWSEHSRGDQPDWGLEHMVYREKLWDLGLFAFRKKRLLLSTTTSWESTEIFEAGPWNCFEQEVELEADLSSTWVTIFHVTLLYEGKDREKTCVQRHPYPHGRRRSNLLSLFPLLYNARPVGRKMSWQTRVDEQVHKLGFCEEHWESREMEAVPLFSLKNNVEKLGGHSETTSSRGSTVSS